MPARHDTPGRSRKQPGTSIGVRPEEAPNRGQGRLFEGPEGPAPDPVELFARLVQTRRTGDHRQAKQLGIELARTGWRIVAVEPRGPGGRP